MEGKLSFKPLVYREPYKCPPPRIWEKEGFKHREALGLIRDEDGTPFKKWLLSKNRILDFWRKYLPGTIRIYHQSK